MKRIITGFVAVLLAFVCATGSFAVEEGYVKMTGFKEAVYALLHKSEIESTQFKGTVSEDTWSESDVYSLEDTVVLTKEKGKDFVILNITDVHFADYDIRALMAFDATATIKRLVKKVQPDLITVSGDIVCSESCEYAIRRFTDLMNSFGIVWAPVFGNHEQDGNCDYNYAADVMMKSPYCLMKKGDPEMGVGNYIINIAEKQEDSSLRVVESLIMMDTHSSHLNEKQIKWYSWAAEGIKQASGNPEVETTVIFHIPSADYQFAYDAAWDADNNCWRDGYEAAGECNEKICCQRDSQGNPYDNGFFDAVKKAGNTKYVFCGHEHMNNFSILYEGVRLTYTLKVGMASGYQPGFNGGTVITVGDSGLKNSYHLFINLFMTKTLELFNHG